VPTEHGVSERPSDLAKLSSGAGTTLVGKFAGRGVQFAGQVLLARVLGPEGFGLYALGWALLGLVRLVAPLGLEIGIVRFGAQAAASGAPAVGGVVRRSLVATLVSSALFGAGLWLLADAISTDLFDEPRVAPVLRLLAPAVPLAALVRVMSAATRVSGQMKLSVLAEDLAQPAVIFVLLVAVQLAGASGVLEATAATTLSFAVALGVASACLMRAFPGMCGVRPVGGAPLHALAAFSIPSMLAASLSVASILVDRIMIGHFRPVHEVGIYQAISQSSMVFMVILNAMNTIFGALVPTLELDGERGRLAEMLRVTTKWAVYLSAPVALVFCLLADPVIEVLFGRAYLDGAPALRLLALAQLANVAVGQIGMVLIMTGRQLSWLALTVPAFALNLVLNIVLVPRLGTTGAAISSLASTTALLGAASWLASVQLGQRTVDRRMLKGLSGAAVAAAALLFVRTVVPGPLAQLAVGAVVAVLVFGAMLRALGLDDEDRVLLGVVRARYDRARGRLR
jgi:O-antigen/teichoic acid export membrane protein